MKIKIMLSDIVFGMALGWFSCDAYYIYMEKPLIYPTWVPIVGLSIINIFLYLKGIFFSLVLEKMEDTAKEIEKDAKRISTDIRDINIFLNKIQDKTTEEKHHAGNTGM